MFLIHFLELFFEFYTLLWTTFLYLFKVFLISLIFQDSFALIT